MVWFRKFILIAIKKRFSVNEMSYLYKLVVFSSKSSCGPFLLGNCYKIIKDETGTIKKD